MKFVPVILILILTITSPIWGHDDDDSSEEEENEIGQLENRCTSQYKDVYVNLEYGDDSVEMYSVGKDTTESILDCAIMIYGPSHSSVVLAIEVYDLADRTSSESKSLHTSDGQQETGECESPLQVSYNTDGQDQKSTFCLGSKQQQIEESANTLRSTNGGSGKTVYYELFHSNSNKLAATLTHRPDSSYYYYIVFSAIRHSHYESDCADDEKLVTGASNSYCLWKPLLCDGHVNYPSAPEPIDEIIGCPKNHTEFQGEFGPTYYTPYLWTKSALFWALIIVPTFGVMAVLIVLLLVQLRKCFARRRLQESQGGSGHVNVIMVPEDSDLKDEKSGSPPDYSSVAELPPAYHSLFLPTENQVATKVPVTPTHVYAYVPEQQPKEGRNNTQSATDA